jgi:acyl-CoA synthetase (AMP-forming)/AMP-acid ligase II
MLSVLHGESPSPERVPITVAGIIQEAGSSSPEGCLYLFQESEEFQSYGLLLEEASKIAGGLERFGVGTQDRVILQIQHPRDFFTSFCACILGGFIAVPMAVPSGGDRDELSSRRLRYAIDHLEPSAILTTADLFPRVCSTFPKKDSNPTRVVALQDLFVSDSPTKMQKPSLQETATILLTSGTTGVPKFVTLSHLNFFTTISGSIRFQNLNRRDISLNWLPFHHVSTLMRAVRDIYLGCRQLQAQTSDVLRDTFRWIDWMDRYRVTSAWTPHFALTMIASADNGLFSGRTWNLEYLRSLMVTGEPVVWKVIETFLDRLKVFGFKRDALHVSWGMTEAPLSVCSREPMPGKGNRRFAVVGKPLPGVSVRVVGAEDNILTQGAEGKIQVKGEHVTKAYYDDSQLNLESFASDGWLRTGDLGTIEDGVLSITGREKELIVIHGMKYSTVEIEAILHNMDGIEPATVCVCSFHNEASATEAFAVFFEPRSAEEDELVQLMDRIKDKIRDEMGISPSLLIPLEKSKIPRSSSGKILRSELRNQLAAGTFQNILDCTAIIVEKVRTKHHRSLNPIESKIARCFEEILKIEVVHPRDNFFNLGGSSVQAIAAASRLSDLVPGRDCSPLDIFQHPTVHQLATFLEKIDNPLETQVLAGTKRAEIRKMRRSQRGNSMESIS